MKKTLKFLIQILLDKGIIALPVFYITSALLLNFVISFKSLILCLIFGFLSHYIFNRWKEESVDDDEIDFTSTSSNDEESESSLKELFHKMPYWERLHWIPIFGFLFLTWYAMVQGLGLLFIQGIDWFIILFSTIVTLVLLWLIMMVSRKKNIFAYVIFYLCFDALSAFSFNFVHFYDNVSATQQMDRDMKACEMYMKLQENNISKIKVALGNQKTQTTSKIENLEKQKTNSQKEMGNVISEKKNADDKVLRRVLNKLVSQSGNQVLDKNNQILKLKNDSVYIESVSANVQEMCNTKDTIDHLCSIYNDNREEFTVDKLKRVKYLVNEIDERITTLSEDSLVKSLNCVILASNDTITWAKNRLKAMQEDRFASINKLYSALFSKENNQIQISESSNSKKSKNNFQTMDIAFENRLLYLSIALSILIDLLPLALGVFVAYSRKKRA